MFLTERADIYRMAPDSSKAGRRSTQVWRKHVACHLEPISAIDHTISFALESTHVVYFPPWLRGLRKEDEIRLGGRITAAGTREPLRYVVKGIQTHPAFGLPVIAAYVEERE